MFRTNLRQVMANLEVMKSPATWGDIAAKAFDQYTGDFPDIAAEALRAAVPEMDNEAVAAFVDSFLANHQYPAMRFMLAGGRNTNNVDRIARGEITAGDVERWVRAGYAGDPAGKEFDERDADVDDVVRKMQGILLFGSNAGARDAARSKYLPLIASFMSAADGNAVTEKAGLAILAAWVRHIRRTWPDICRAHLQALAT